MKSWYTSKTIWGSLITIIAMILGAFGYSVGADDQATVTDVLTTIAGFGGTVLAIYGRVKASKAIK